MKRIIALILLIACIFTVSSCGLNIRAEDTSGNDGRMKTIYNDGYLKIYVDVKTGVQYFARNDSGVCVMVDESGNPLIWEED